MRKHSAFTLIELLVVIAILATLLIISFGSWRNQIDKARDADRKADLQRLSVAFEDYFNDHECYPPAAWFDAPDDCGSDNLQPYLDKIPCDPVTKQPYYLEHSDCRGYRLLVTLDYNQDPVIASLNCQGALACGYGANYNYGIASGNLTVANPDNPAASASPTTSPPASALPTPSLSPSASPAPVNYYACNLTGSCTYRGTNPPPGCGSYYWPDNCQVDCADPIYQCTD